MQAEMAIQAVAAVQEQRPAVLTEVRVYLPPYQGRLYFMPVAAAVQALQHPAVPVVLAVAETEATHLFTRFPEPAQRLIQAAAVAQPV
jgi:hypothetical protein